MSKTVYYVSVYHVIIYYDTMLGTCTYQSYLYKSGKGLFSFLLYIISFGPNSILSDNVINQTIKSIIFLEIKRDSWSSGLFLAPGAQGPRINTWPGHSRFGRD